ncbi:MAG: glycosyltransferase family 39 protein [Candidatus Hydrogenedentes bacterium]|nr:glycosyltransferase family 39 protein [Candidatus Hydrogenedentota bacterium]
MTDPDETIQPSLLPATRRQWFVAIILPALLLLPFINKPIHIDDAAYIAIAKHITQHPYDYYGVSLNWEGVSAPVYQWHASPPLANIYLACIGALFGWQEWVLHMGFLLPAILASLGTFTLARRLCKRPLIAVAATCCTPAFVVSGTTLMLDMWLLAFILLSIASWIEGMQTHNLRWLAFAALCAGLAAWSKYFGIVLIPLLAGYTLIFNKRPTICLLFLLIPIAMIAVEQVYCYQHYGRSLFGNVSDVVTEDRPDRPLWLWLMVAFSFCGGSTFSVMQIGAVLWNGRLKVLGASLVAAMSCIFYYLNANGIRAQTLGFDLPLVSLIFYAIFMMGGTQILSLCTTDVRNRRDPESWLLTFWVFGTFLFAAFVTWSVNVRSLLPLVPPMAILAARRIDTITFDNPKRANRRIASSLVLSALVSLGVARSDMTWAQTVRDAATRYAQIAKSHPGATYFQGHWGFQHYMQDAGIAPFDFETTELKPGDMIVYAQNNANVRPLPDDYIAERRSETVAINRRIATMSTELGAGFYSDLWGPLPFALGEKMPPDTYFIDVISKPGKPFALQNPGNGRSPLLR